MRNSGERGFTLLEIFVGIAILAILLALVVISAERIRNYVEGVKCAGNLRALHASFSTYVNDNGHWPQEPPELAAANDDAYEDWWIETMKPYGVTEKVWQCPSVIRQVTSKSRNGRPKIHYTPSLFDIRPFTPYKFKTQPWLVENGNMHGDGALICYPNGEIKTMNEALGYRK